jgi:hypothetical protein
MALPTVVKTWTISPNNRITFVSLLDTTQRYALGVKNFLKTNGYTVKGSCTAGTGAMDGVDRWTVSTDVTPRGTISAASQAWFVLTDGNGCDLLLDFQGGTDDVFRVAFSPTGVYVAAGTANNAPTATDEQVILSTTWIAATASADRLWNGWVDSQKKLCRFAIARSGAWVGSEWGLELTTPRVVSPPATWSPAVWGFNYVPNVNFFSNSTVTGIAAPVIASVRVSVSVQMGLEVYGASDTQWQNIQTEAQGANGYPMWPFYIGTNTTNAEGKLGDLIDWWLGRTTTVADGDTYGTLQFINMNGSGNPGGVVWPWNGATTPVLT